MMRKIGTSQFRKRLRDYLYDTSTTGTTYQITSDEYSALILSPETLAALQKRHVVNLLFSQGYDALSLHQYMTLTSGNYTKELPLDTIIALSKVFQLLQEVTRLLARPGAKENAVKWDVSRHLQAAADHHHPVPGGEFEGVCTVVFTIFSPEDFDGCHTLLSFFNRTATLASEEKPKLQLTELDDTQQIMVLEILRCTSEWAAELLEYQVLSNGLAPERAVLKFLYVLNWYEFHVKDLPEATKQCKRILLDQ